MPKNLNQISDQKPLNQKTSKSRNSHLSQYVSGRSSNQLPSLHRRGLGSSSLSGSILHSLPFETLINVTAWLDPNSLIALGAVDKYLKGYTDNDVVWQVAFLAHFLDIAPEEQRSSPREVLLKRTEGTWKREFIARYYLLQRWERSRAATTTHIPLQLPVTSMHLLRDKQSLLCFSADFGVAVRSLPATGKILKGRLLPFNTDPTGPLWPRPHLCAFASEGGTAKVAWGTQSGEALYTVVTKVMEATSRRNGRSIRCDAVDQHTGAVNQVAWAHSKAKEYEYFVTAGADGRIKIWNAFTCLVVWEAPSRISPCVLAAFDLNSRIVAGIFKDGQVMVWSDIQFENGTPDARVPIMSQLSGIDPASQNLQASDFVLDGTNPTHPSILVHLNGDPHLWKVCFDVTQGTTEATRLDGPMAPITSVHFDPSASNPDVVYAGDAVGQMYVWSWNAATKWPEDPHGSRHAPPVRTWDTDDANPISMIRTNGSVVLTGSERGVLRVWDVLSLRFLRLFKSPVPKPSGNQAWHGVANLVLDGDQFIASVGKYVVHWKAGLLTDQKPWKIKKKAGVQSNVGRWNDFAEVHRAIKESQAELEITAKSAPRVTATMQDQLDVLQKLGLQETEAVEYALMLSHDEALRNEQDAFTASQPASSGEDTSRARTISSTSTSTSPPTISPSTSLRASPPRNATGKVLVVRPEPMSMGGLARRPPSKSPSRSFEEFPSITGGNSSAITSRAPDSGLQSRGSIPRGDDAVQGAPTKPWSKVVRSPNKGHGAWSGTLQARQNSRPTLSTLDDEEAQLQFVLELSLAEARSQGSAN